MKKIITSFGGVEQGKNRHNVSYNLHRNYSKEVERLFKSAESYGFDGYWMYDSDWLLNSAYNNPLTYRVLSGSSYNWAFKPIVIRDALSMLASGDVLMWVDSNDILISDPQPILDFAVSHNLFLHDHTPSYYPNKDWTYRDMFVRMGCDEEKYWNFGQVQVNIMAFCKTQFTIDFVDEWVRYATDYDTMVANTMQNFDSFRDHRYEQSICSILTAKYGLTYTSGYPYGIAHEEMGISI